MITQRILKVNSFRSLMNSRANIFFIDIEETILAPNIFYELAEAESYKSIFSKLCESNNVKTSDCLYYGKNFTRKLMERIIPQIITSLRNSGKMVFALTSGCPSTHKKEKLIELGVHLNGYLFTKGNDKGPFLVKFLEGNEKKMGDKTCAVLDNHKTKIMNIIDSCKTFSKNNSILESYLYTRKYVFAVSVNDFTKYWSDVIHSINEGGLLELRKRIERETQIKRQKRQEQLNTIKV